MDSETRIKVVHYRDRSDELLFAMQFFLDDVQFRASLIGLLAVHSSIAMNDAITLAVLGKRSRDSDHKNAAKYLSRACSTWKVGAKGTQGVAQLSWLLDRKTLISYGDRRLDHEMMRQAASKAFGFSDWAYVNFKGVLRDQS